MRTGDLVAYDAGSRTEIKRLKVGRGAAILRGADGDCAFVSCTPDNFIALVDLKTLETIGRLDVGGRSDGLAWAVRD